MTGIFKNPVPTLSYALDPATTALIAAAQKKLTPKTPDIATPAPITNDTAAVKAAAQAEADLIKKKRGFASTIKTGPQGITTAPNTLKTTLG